MPGDRAGVSRGHSRRDAIPVNGMAGNKPGENESREVLPAEGPNTEKGRITMSFHNTMNPKGGVVMGHVVDSSNLNERLLEQMLSRENMQAAWKRVKAFETRWW